MMKQNLHTHETGLQICWEKTTFVFDHPVTVAHIWSLKKETFTGNLNISVNLENHSRSI